ncbi:MAG: hypothetical protein ACREMA_08450 [Longimicrobiales bacterium]
MNRQYVAAVALWLAACTDVAGPRPRPGAPADSVNGPGGTGLVWYSLEPRVISLGQTDSVRVSAVINGSGSAVVITRSGEQYSLRRAGTQYSASLPISALLSDLRPGDLHTVGAQIALSGESTRTNISFNIRDGSLPNVAVRALVPGVQATDRILNLRVDSATVSTTVSSALMREVYRHLFDNYDFVAVVEAVRSSRKATYLGVRNNITGVGLTQFDNTVQYGSAGRLQGILQFPSDDVYDLGATSSLRVLGERWMNFTRVGLLSVSRPHWPLSSLAYGVMGLGSGANSQSIPFPYQLTQVSNGYRLDATEPATEFNDFELYLMGLLPAQQVRAGVVFRDQGLIASVRNGAVIAGPVDSVHINDIIAIEGPRNPPFSTTQPTFRIATVVLSLGRLLSAQELAFYDHMAARGETETVLAYVQGLTRGQTRPLFLATGQRARLNARLGQ